MGRRIDQNWEPDPGNDFMGIVTDALVVEGTRYGDIDVAIVTDVQTDQKIGVWLGRKVLANLFEKKRPRLGSLIHLWYLGPETSNRTGFTYHDYRMGAGDKMEPTGRDWIEDFRDELDKAKHTR